jgi:phosphoesterase RecJ-like protein
LTNGFQIEQFDTAVHIPLMSTFDVCFVVDVSEWKRLGLIADTLRASSFPIVCIDHHLSAGKLGDPQVIDPNASSTGELIYDFLTTMNADLSQGIVDSLYTAILTDTGSFKFSNTTAQTHQITSDLLAKGANFTKIYSELYESDSISRILLKGHLLANMKFEKDGRFAWFVMSYELQEKLGAKPWESEGFSDLPRAVKSVEISIMFSEDADGLAKASFRSKGRIPINTLAEQFGGGGHKFASGAALEWPLHEAVDKVTTAAKIYLDQFPLNK